MSNLSEHFHLLKTGHTVYNLDTTCFSDEELHVATSLQGVVAQKEAQISLSIPEDWKNAMISMYGTEFIQLEGLWEAVEKFKPFLNGIVTYSDASQINIAATVAGAYGYLTVSKELLPEAIKLGLKVKAEAGVDYISEYDAFKKCKHLLCGKFVCHQIPSNPALRDLAIAVKAPIYTSSESKDELLEIYDWAEDLGAVIGWYYDEVAGVGLSSQHGLMTLPSDHAYNLSLFSGLEPREQKQKPIKRLERPGEKVHYVTFLLSDGDNLQVHTNNYRLHNFASKRRGEIPYGFTTSPSMYNMAPIINSYYYERETENDDFLAAVSGVGYCNPALLPKDLLLKYAELSGEFMGKSDIVNTVLLMDTPEHMLIDQNEHSINNLYDITAAFSAQPQIEGGFMYFGGYYCPDLVPGCVFWNNGKPFNGIRETLWHGSNISKEEYCKNLANKINSYPKNPSVIEGYTAINVQYWQYYYDEVADFVKLFDKDVVVVTPREFIDIMKRNVSDKTTKLYLDK